MLVKFTIILDCDTQVFSMVYNLEALVMELVVKFMFDFLVADL